MNIGKMWSEFERAIINSPANSVMDILYSAALKKKSEIEDQEDIELSDIFVRNLVQLAKRRRRSPNEQLRYIKSYYPQDTEDL